MTVSEKLADLGSDILSSLTTASRAYVVNPFFWTTLALLGVCAGLFLFQRPPNRSSAVAAAPTTQDSQRQVPQDHLSPPNATPDQTSAGEDIISHLSNLAPTDPLPHSASATVALQTAVIPEDLPPQQPIVLKLKRSQKQGAMGGNIYMLDARIDVSAEVRALIAAHNFGSRVIYESAARQKHAAKTQAHLADSRDNTSLFAPPSQQAMGVANTFWRLGRAAVSAARASLSLRVTVNSLLSGVHVECKSMEELLEAEDAFREAKQNLQVYIESVQSFDGREEII